MPSSGERPPLSAVLATAALGVLVALAACSSPGSGRPAGPVAGGATAGSSAAEPPVAGEPPRLAEATLTDLVQPAAEGRISWSTAWRACFAGPGGIARWEAQTLTSEGVSAVVRPLSSDGCLQLEVASGTNPRAAGMVGRDVQLSDAQALAYRARGVRPDGTVTPWTPPVRVGRVTTLG